MKLRLTDAQVSAMECRDWTEEPVVRRCWDGGAALLFDAQDREPLYAALQDASNAEDAHAEYVLGPGDCRTYARRAARSLATLAGRVLRAS